MEDKFVNIGDKAVDVKLVRGYTSEALEHLDKQLSYKVQFDEVVEAAAAGTGLEKKFLSAYFKARYKETTKELSEKGEQFQALDIALDFQ